MSADLHIANALRLAHEDLEAAEVLTAIGNRNDAYHAQQAAEKILIALLTSENIRAERKDAHRLDVLQSLLPDANPFKRKFDPILFLTIYATTYRYPKDAGRLPAKADSEELGVAMHTVRQILDEVAHISVLASPIMTGFRQFPHLLPATNLLTTSRSPPSSPRPR